LKDINIKVWPEVTGYLPSLIPLPAIEDRENNIFLDFSNCNNFNSSGLNIFLIQLLKYALVDNVQRSWHSDEFSQVPVIKEIAKYNFFKIFNSYCPNISLFNNENLHNDSDIDPSVISFVV